MDRYALQRLWRRTGAAWRRLINRNPDGTDQRGDPRDPRMPWPLLKATTDDCFEYAMGLKNGTIIIFAGAQVHGEWVTLDVSGGCFQDAGVFPATEEQQEFLRRERFRFERDIAVRLDQIAWVCDAPRGS